MSNAELIAKAQQARSPVMEAGAINGDTVKWCTLCHTRWHTDRVEGEQHELTCPWPLVSQLAAALAQADAALAARWQQIDTAKHDGSLMMLYWPDLTGLVPVIGYYRAKARRFHSDHYPHSSALAYGQPEAWTALPEVPLPQPPRTDRETPELQWATENVRSYPRLDRPRCPHCGREI